MLAKKERSDTRRSIGMSVFSSKKKKLEGKTLGDGRGIYSTSNQVCLKKKH